MNLIEYAVPIMAAASRRINTQEILLMVLVAALILITELVLFYVPGVSISTLLIAIACLKFGFVPCLAIVIPPIIIAHFIWLKNPSIVIGDIITMIVMIFFGVHAGPFLIKYAGWAIFGVLFGLVKWGAMIVMTLLYGGNMTKRVQNLFLEPIFNFFIFWKLRFLFAFLM